MMSNFKLNIRGNFRSFFILFAVVLVSLCVVLGGVMTLIHYRALPFLTSGTAMNEFRIVYDNLLPILSILIIPTIVASLFLMKFGQTHERLKKLLSLDENALALVSDSVYIHDINGDCMFSSKNNRSNGGNNNNQVTGENTRLFKDLIRPRIGELIKSGEMTFESQYPQKDSSFIQVEVHSRFIESGNRNSVLSIVRDITQRKQTEEELRQSYKSLRIAMNGTINSMASIVEARDPYTAGHQQRVAKLATSIAQELGLPDEQIEGVRVAGILHDIGKISVPAEILSKPGRLRKSEFDLVKDHSEIGYGLLKAIEFSHPIAQIVLQHHERIDGSGYPNGLSGENIIKEALIMGVADVIEAMSSHRPYRPAFPVEKALLEIIMKKGILYDQEVVDACVRLFNDKGFSFE